MARRRNAQRSRGGRPHEAEGAPGQSRREIAGQARKTGAWFTVSIVLAAFSLRPAIVAVGPLTAAIQDGTGLSSTATSLLTTVPLICLGLVAASASALSGRLGVDRAVLAALALVVAGITVRLLDPLSALFAGTVIAASGIALGNVLAPAAVKQYRPERVGAMMAVYSVALQSGATLASAATVPVRATFGLGWREALALWGLPAAVACGVWGPRAARTRTAAGHTAAGTAVWRSMLGWTAALFIGLQSGVYFALTAWLPTLLHDHGLSNTAAGYMLSVVGVAGIAGGLPMPVLATRMRQQTPLVLSIAAAFAAGLLGLLAAPASAAALWSVLLGLGQGGGLSLALTLFTLRTRTAIGAAQLSGMAQTAGYLIAAAGPFAAGWAHALTGGWAVPLVLLLAALVPLTAAGIIFARPRYLEDQVPSTGAE